MKIIKNMAYALGFYIQKVPKKKIDLELYPKIFPRNSISKKLFFNVGAGSFFHPYWTNIDMASNWYKHVQKQPFVEFDLLSLKKMPIESNIAEVVYSSHVIEHITDEAAQNMFNEAYRILKDDGIFRITAPNIDLDYLAFLHNDKNYFYWNSEKEKQQYSVTQLFLRHFASYVSTMDTNSGIKKMSDDEFKLMMDKNGFEETLNYCTSKCSLELQKREVGNHINWWNKEKSFRMLKKAGFNNVYLSAYGQSQSPILRNVILFDNTHPKISIYIEAKK